MLRSSMMLGGGGFTVWNPNDKQVTVALSQGNLRAVVTDASYGSVRAINPRLSGKWYFEVTLLLSLGDQAVVGVMKSNATLASFVGADANGYGYASDGVLYNNGVSAGGSSPGTYSTSGDVIGVAVDLDNRKIWFRKNGAAWPGAGDPATNTGGLAIWATVPVYPACSARNSQGLTANFGASAFGAAAPSGFRAWGT